MNNKYTFLLGVLLGTAVGSASAIGFAESLQGLIVSVKPIEKGVYTITVMSEDNQIGEATVELDAAVDVTDPGAPGSCSVSLVGTNIYLLEHPTDKCHFEVRLLQPTGDKPAQAIISNGQGEPLVRKL